MSGRDASGAAISVWGRSSPVISCCTFRDNRARRGGGAIGFYGSTRSQISDCIFVNNSAGRVGGGSIECGSSAAPRIQHCVFHGESAPAGGAIYCKDRSHPHIQSTIIAFCSEGEAIACTDNAHASLRCCDLYGNAGGDWVGQIADQLGASGNVSRLPMFADPDGGEFTLRGDSPLRELPGCGSIGIRADGDRRR
jgi:hypothetical protein